MTNTYATVYTDKWKAIHSINAISERERQKLAAAMLDYACLDIEPKGLSNLAMGMFEAIKTSLFSKNKGGQIGNRNAQKKADSETNNKTNEKTNTENEYKNESKTNGENESEKTNKNELYKLHTTDYKLHTTKPPISPRGYSTSFEKFWDAYPKSRHVDKPNAFKAFERALKKTDLETILDAIERQKRGEAWLEDNGKYIPHPSTWLNGGRWEDEVRMPEAEVSQENHPVEIMKVCPKCGSFDVATKGMSAICLSDACGCSFIWSHKDGKWKEEC